MVIGMSDGLTVPFALAAGLSVAIESTNIIVMAGVAEIAAGSIAMALGGYFSARSELEDHHHLQSGPGYADIEKNDSKDFGNTREFFANLGLSEELQIQATEEIAKDKNKWMAFMAKYETAHAKVDDGMVRRSAFNIGIFYIAGGLVPLAPYLFLDDAITALKYTSVITLLTLFLFGWFKGRIMGQHPFLSAARVTIIGAAAAAAAFGVAKIFIAASFQ